MSQENVEVVRRAFETAAARGLRATAQIYWHPAVEYCPGCPKSSLRVHRVAHAGDSGTVDVHQPSEADLAHPGVAVGGPSPQRPIVEAGETH
jgi:hypothetical protein